MLERSCAAGSNKRTSPKTSRRRSPSAHAALCTGAPEAAVAVRSSATTEDAGDASFAGLQDTYLWIKGADQVLRMVRSCWASLYSVESITYRRSRGFQEHDVAMAVVVQTMVDAQIRGCDVYAQPSDRRSLGDRN